ncbi:MAG: signal peptidase I [Ruminococcus sp.]|nr:signal peptidase I [Ruminococcus sp.]
MNYGKKIGNEILEWCESFVFAMMIVMLLFIFVFRQVRVNGPSMESTLLDGDRVIMFHGKYTPHHGDIVIVDSEACADKSAGEKSKIIIKRVIGVEGDTILIDYNTNEVFVNDELISNENIKDYDDQDNVDILMDSPYFDPSYAVDDGVYAYVVPEGNIFVMGDNRNNSKDSRTIGFVETDTIWGHPVFRVYPFDKIGKI